MISFNVRSATALLLACALSLSLTGCTLANTAAPSAMAGTPIAGNVHGGQQPVTGGRIYLLAANPAGYGSASISMLTSASTGNAVDGIGAYVTSGGTGGFDITGDYSCTTGYTQGASTTSGGVTLPGDEQVYLYAVGGNPGLGTGTNSGIGLLAALGPCNAQFSQTLLQVNEVTTVAAAYALAGFATDATHIASSGSTLALTGLTNAGLNSQNLANLTTGLPPSTTTGRNGFVPANNITTIANILAACINGASGNSSCSTLFQNTKGAGGTTPSDTASATINLAHIPYPGAAGVTALYGLVTATPAFGGGLTAQPNDFTLGITFTGGGFANATANGIAIDASGDVWSTSGNRLCKFSSTGTAISPSSGFMGGGFAGSKNIAIDNAGNVWTANLGSSTFSKFSNSGTAISGNSGYSGASGGLNSPFSIAIDASSNVWIANQFGSSVSKFSNTGTAISGSNGYVDNGLNVNFYGIAIDTAGNAWAANVSNGSFSEFSNSGTQLSPSTGWYGNGLGSVYAVAIDSTGKVWGPNYYSDSLGDITSSGGAVSPVGGYRGGGLNTPEALAIDSSGRVWTANFNGNSVSAFDNSGNPLSPQYGYGAYSGNGLYGPVAIAIDGSGNVWVTDYNGGLTEFIGAGSPVVTPIAANLVTPYGTATVNRP